MSDRELLDATESAAGDERLTTAQLVALLAELDSRQLYLGEGYASLFTYCRHRLRLAEFSAYSRITAARAARRFPVLLQRLADGAISLTTIGLLSAHLTEENHEALLDAVHHASKRDVECLVASLYGQPDIPASIRRLPEVAERSSPAEPPSAASSDAESGSLLPHDAATSPGAEPALRAEAPSIAAATLVAAPAPMPQPAVPTPARRDAIAPLAVGRYLLRVTIGAETHARLDRAKDLLRHVVPNGDLAIVLDRALAVLVDQLERRKTGRAAQPRRQPPASSPARGRHSGRHIAAAVRRDVWARDEGRCAFIGPHGRCHETGFLEYHHVVPYARGGASDAANIELRCRAHNAYEAVREFGEAAQPARSSSS